MRDTVLFVDRCFPPPSLFLSRSRWKIFQCQTCGTRPPRFAATDSARLPMHEASAEKLAAPLSLASELRNAARFARKVCQVRAAMNDDRRGAWRAPTLPRHVCGGVGSETRAARLTAARRGGLLSAYSRVLAAAAAFSTLRGIPRPARVRMRAFFPRECLRPPPRARTSGRATGGLFYIKQYGNTSTGRKMSNKDTPGSLPCYYAITYHPRACALLFSSLRGNCGQTRAPLQCSSNRLRKAKRECGLIL